MISAAQAAQELAPSIPKVTLKHIDHEVQRQRHSGG
jgi:hypothetical protein